MKLRSLWKNIPYYLSQQTTWNWIKIYIFSNIFGYWHLWWSKLENSHTFNHFIERTTHWNLTAEMLKLKLQSLKKTPSKHKFDPKLIIAMLSGLLSTPPPPRSSPPPTPHQSIRSSEGRHDTSYTTVIKWSAYYKNLSGRPLKTGESKAPSYSFTNCSIVLYLLTTIINITPENDTSFWLCPQTQLHIQAHSSQERSDTGTNSP